MVSRIDEINRVRCPELDAGDKGTLRALTPLRPWTEASGATRGQLQDRIDALEIGLERKRAAGERVIAEHQRCRGGEAAPEPTS